MQHDAGFHRMELSRQMLVNCFASRKGKGWWSGGSGGWRGGGRQMSEIRGTPAAVSGCSIGGAVRAEKERGRERGAELCLSDCVSLCSLV